MPLTWILTENRRDSVQYRRSATGYLTEEPDCWAGIAKIEGRHHNNLRT